MYAHVSMVSSYTAVAHGTDVKGMCTRSEHVIEERTGAGVPCSLMVSGAAGSTNLRRAAAGRLE